MEDSYRARRGLYLRLTGTKFCQGPTLEHRRAFYLASQPARTPELLVSGIPEKSFSVWKVHFPQAIDRNRSTLESERCAFPLIRTNNSASLGKYLLQNSDIAH